jgi:pyruvate-formate lyase-activating enzyme
MNITKTLTIIPTYKCTASCKDCCFGSNPTITKRIPQKKILQYIDDAKQMRSIDLICFSGGEPFLLKNDLVKAVNDCCKSGVLSRIVTNGYWATSLKVARDKLSELVKAGLNEINFSTGKDHLEWVDLSYVLNGLEASFELGITTALMIELRADSDISKNEIIRFAREEGRSELANFLEEDRIKSVESPWMSFQEISSVDANLTTSGRRLNKLNLDHFGPCQSIFKTLVVSPSEHLGVCCGLPREEIPNLTLGSLAKDSLKFLLSSGRDDLLKIWLFLEGPEQILAYAASHNPEIEWENKYSHQCDVCRRVMTDPVILKAASEIDDVKINDLVSKFSVYLSANTT